MMRNLLKNFLFIVCILTLYAGTCTDLQSNGNELSPDELQIRERKRKENDRRLAGEKSEKELQLKADELKKTKEKKKEIESQLNTAKTEEEKKHLEEERKKQQQIEEDKTKELEKLKLENEKRLAEENRLDEERRQAEFLRKKNAFSEKKWRDLVIDRSFVPNQPTSSRIPAYYLAAFDADDQLYLKAAIEPFTALMPNKAKNLSTFIDYGVSTPFVQTSTTISFKELFPSLGSFYAVKDDKIVSIPSLKEIKGKWKFISSYENDTAFFISDTDDLYKYDEKQDKLQLFQVEGSKDNKIKYISKTLFIDREGKLLEEKGTTANTIQTQEIASGFVWNVAIKFWNAYFAISDDDKLYHWGIPLPQDYKNLMNQEKKSPQQLGTDSDWAKIIVGQNSGDNYAFFLKKNGELFALGGNKNNFLGVTKTDTYISLPTPVKRQLRFSKFVTYNGAHFGIDMEGYLYAWGNNYYVWDKVTPGTLGIKNQARVMDEPMRVLE